MLVYFLRLENIQCINIHKRCKNDFPRVIAGVRIEHLPPPSCVLVAIGYKLVAMQCDTVARKKRAISRTF